MEETARCLLLILLTLSHILKERIGRGKPGSKYDPAARTKRAQTALRPFLAHMPPDTGMVFVMVQHLDPRHPSMLVDVLVTMRVTLAKNGEKVAANRVYIIPPDATLTIENGTLQVTTPASPREHRRPIDTFFASLAEDQGERAASIVLSGVGSEGTSGLRPVKANGGLAGPGRVRCGRLRRRGRGHA